MSKQKSFLDKIHTPNWLTLLLGIVFIFRIPSLLEPYSYGDEMIYLSLGNAVRHGLVLYRDIHDNKPPLLYLFAAVSGNLFWFRAILAGWAMATVVIFWKLICTLTPKNINIQKVSTITFAILTTIPMLEGQIANSEIFMIGPIMLAFFILLSKKNNTKNLLFAGFLFSIATLFKMPAAFDVPVIFFFWIITSKPNINNYLLIIKKMFIISIGFAIPLLATFVWYYYQNALNEYVVAAFMQNVGYLSSFRPGDVVEPFWVRNAPLLMRAGLVFSGIVILGIFRKKLSKPYIFAGCYLLMSLFAVTLSERPYPHYIIQIVPAISIFIGFLIAKQNKEQSLAIIPIFVALIPILYFKFWYYPTASYYQRFLEMATGQINQQEYFDKFDGNINRNYEISKFITSSTSFEDQIFVWGNSSTIYALSNRMSPIKYIADYHINDFYSKEEVVKKISENMPVLIIWLPESESFLELKEFVKSNYRLINDIDGAQIWYYNSPDAIK